MYDGALNLILDFIKDVAVNRPSLLTLILCSSCWAYLMMAMVSSSIFADSSKKASMVSWFQVIWFLKASSCCSALNL